MVLPNPHIGPTPVGLSVRTLTGRIKIHPVGYGFVVPDDKSEDVHISPPNRGAAMDADTVEIEAWMGVRGLEGRVLRVIERGRAKVTGQIVRRGRQQMLQPDDPRISGLVGLTGSTLGAKEGVSVVAEITRYPDVPDGPMEASVLKVLGDPDDPRTEVEKVLAIADVDEAFPDEVEKIAAGFGDTLSERDRADRTDLRHVPFTTIDPETARDFDDAVAIEKLPHGGSRLWVAVADVSHYVREGSPIDTEARRRGCSIYLPNRAIPMLPEHLSGKMCSLVPEEDRLAMVVRIDIDKHGTIGARDFCAAVIHSKARLDYPGVAAALGGDTRGKRRKYEPFLPALRAMDSLARQLRAARLTRGALDFDLPEPFVELDHDDPRLVRTIRKSRRDPGERQAYSMIEEFMLAANEAVASSFQERAEDTLWRIHDAPDRNRVEEFATLAEHYGIAIDVDDARTPKGLKKVLDRLHGHPAEKALSFQLLRSLKQATYDVVNIGHFGLASADYLHFTSPIRRYPDLVVHRLLKARLAALGRPAGGFKTGATTTDRPSLQKMAADSSFAERQAMEVEREVIGLYRAFFLRDRVGDVFEGVISSVTGFGVFVQVDDPFVEGLIRIDQLSDDYYNYDEAACRLVGRRSGRAFALGDSVKVEVQSVSVVRRQVDFALAEHTARQRARDAGHGDRRRRDRHRERGKDQHRGDRNRRGGERKSNRPRGNPKKKGRR
jgi:ribonuclease R